jgi:hypothetical protein
MPDAVLIAVISSGGVILVGLIQWMSNRTTVKAAQVREKELKEQQSETLRLEREERQKERDHSLALAEREREHLREQDAELHRRTVRDQWRETRVEVYENALTALASLNTQAGKIFTELHLNNDLASFERENTILVRDLQALIETRGRVDLYGSSPFGKKLTEYVNALLLVSAKASQIQERLECNGAVDPQDMLKEVHQLGRISDDLKQVAKQDLGTLD